MIFDPRLLFPTEYPDRLVELFSGGRLYVVRHALPMQSPLDTQPLFGEFDGKTLGMVCTEPHIQSKAFRDYLERMGVKQNVWSTTSCSRPDALMFQVLVMRKKRPAIEGMLLDPPKSTTLSLGPGHGTKTDVVLQLPPIATIIEYFHSIGADPEQIRNTISMIRPSQL